MKSLLLLTITIASHLTLGQGYSQYKEIDFPKGKFLTKIDQRTLGTITVELIQVKPITNDPSLPDCLTWLTIREGDKVIKELNKGILAVGGCSGFYFPPRQPNKSLIVISKFGDYDGGIITIDNQGQFTEKMGGRLKG